MWEPDAGSVGARMSGSCDAPARGGCDAPTSGDCDALKSADCDAPTSTDCEARTNGDCAAPRWSRVEVLGSVGPVAAPELAWLDAALQGQSRAVLWQAPHGLVAPLSY